MASSILTQHPTHKMPDTMQLGPPTLIVRNIERELAFYQKNFGLKVNRRGEDTDHLPIVELGFQNHFKNPEPLLVLKHDPEAKATPHNYAGLYHYAVLVPDRKSLTSTYLAIGNSGASYEGFADHTVSESLYLHDDEWNGIEIYADRPRATWARFTELMQSPEETDIRMFMSLNKPLDFNSLLRELTHDDAQHPLAFPTGARIGHVHLRVTDLERSVRFYHEKLGLAISGNLPQIGAAFLSVAGYHHHIGLNTWHSLGGKPHEQGEAGLDSFVMHVPATSHLDGLAEQLGAAVMKRSEQHIIVTDPDGIEIQIRSQTRSKTAPNQ